MANSGVQIPGAPSGTLADTFTVASGDHRQVVVVGSPTADANVAEVNTLGASLVNQPDVRSLANSLTLTSGNNVTLSGLNGQGTCAVQVTGSWTGTVTFEGTVDGSTWASIYLSQFGSPNQQLSTATANGMWQAPCAGLQGVRVRCSVTGTGTATVSLSASSAPHHPDSAPWRPDGWARIAMDPVTSFTDTFESFDLTNRWYAGGLIPVVGSGTLTCNLPATALASSYAWSRPTFSLYATAFENVISIVSQDAAAVTGVKRWWGVGIPADLPTAAVPLANGVVFETLDTDGSLAGAVYSNGVRTASVALNRPTDGALHRYAHYRKTSRVYFEIDNIQVGSIALPNPAVANLPITIGAVNGASPSGASTLGVATIGLADTGRNAAAIADGTTTWRRATVKDAGVAAAKTDTGLVVALHPSSPLPGVTFDGGALVVEDVFSDPVLRELVRISALLSAIAGIYLDDDELFKE